MLSITGRGYVGKAPELKVSVRGTPYCKFAVDTHPKTGQKYPQRLHLTAFGDKAELCSRLTVGTEVEVTAEPSARGYLNKKNEPSAVLEGIVTICKVLGNPSIPDVTLEDEDIPF